MILKKIISCVKKQYIVQIEENKKKLIYCISKSDIFFQRAPSELSAHQKKILPIDDHVGVSIAGLTADARLLW